MKISKFLLAYRMPARRRLDSSVLLALPISSKPILVRTATNCSVSQRSLRRWILPNLRQIIRAEGFSMFAHVGRRTRAITFSGGSNWYGAVIDATMNDSVGTAMRYDRSLAANNGLAGKFQVVGFTWNKF